MKSLENSHWSPSFQNDPPQWRHPSCLELKLQKSFLGSEGGRAHKEKQHCSCDASSYLGIFCEDSVCKGNATIACTPERPSVARQGQLSVASTVATARTTASSVSQLRPLPRTWDCLQAPPPGCPPASGLTSSPLSCPKFKPFPLWVLLAL